MRLITIQFLDDMRLSSKELFPLPIYLDVPKHFSDLLSISEPICLRDPEGLVIAILYVESIYFPDKHKEKLQAYGTNDDAHPSVAYLNHSTNEVYLGGELIALNNPRHFDF